MFAARAGMVPAYRPEYVKRCVDREQSVFKIVLVLLLHSLTYHISKCLYTQVPKYKQKNRALSQT